MRSFNMLSIEAVVMLVVLACHFMSSGEAKLLRRSRYYDDNNNFDGPYGPVGPMATGERAIITVRGARSPYDGGAPAKIAIEDQPYRGPYPRGVYDRLDGGYPIGGGGGGGPRSMYPRQDPYAYNGGPYGNSGSFDRQMFGAPSRIGVTGAFPYGYGARGY